MYQSYISNTHINTNIALLNIIHKCHMRYGVQWAISCYRNSCKFQSKTFNFKNHKHQTQSFIKSTHTLEIVYHQFYDRLFSRLNNKWQEFPIFSVLILGILFVSECVFRNPFDKIPYNVVHKVINFQANFQSTTSALQTDINLNSHKIHPTNNNIIFTGHSSSVQRVRKNNNIFFFSAYKIIVVFFVLVHFSVCDKCVCVCEKLTGGTNFPSWYKRILICQV